MLEVGERLSKCWEHVAMLVLSLAFMGLQKQNRLGAKNTRGFRVKTRVNPEKPGYFVATLRWQAEWWTHSVDFGGPPPTGWQGLVMVSLNVGTYVGC